MAGSWGLLLLLLGVTVVCGDVRVKRIVGGGHADMPPTVDPAMKDKLVQELGGAKRKPQTFPSGEKKVATVNGFKTKEGIQAFLGIRYAQPPVNNLRFQRPRRMKLGGVVEGKKYGPPCPQMYNGRLVGSEDCLFLNVYTPEAPSGNRSASYPVMVWIHGGNFKTGSAAQYLPTDIVKKGVVVVTIQYRLGSLGFLSLKSKDLKGNLGMLDISSAVLWVRDYIKFFGGDNTRITVAGQGSGGSCAASLAFNKIIKGLLHGVIAMSGTPVSPFSRDEDGLKTSKKVSQLDGCTAKEGAAVVTCLQNLPVEAILNGDSGLQAEHTQEYNYAKKLSNLMGPGPVEEGEDDFRFLPGYAVESSLEALKSGHFPDIPLLTGVTKKETDSAIKGNFLGQIKKIISPSFLKGGLFKDLLNANTGMFDGNSPNSKLSKLFDTGTYTNFFSSVVSSTLGGIEQVVEHTTDAFFNLPAFLTSHLWSQKNNVYLYSFEQETKPTANKFLNDVALVPKQGSNISNEAKEPGHGDDLIYLFDIQTLEGKPLTHSSKLSNANKIVRNHFTTAVAEFVKTGTPKIMGAEPWLPFKKETGRYMIIKEKPELGSGFRKCSMGLWTGDTNTLMNSVDCGLSQAGKVVTDTVGAAGTELLNTADAVRGKVGDTISGLADRFGGLLPFGGQQQQTSQAPNKPSPSGFFGIG